MKRSILVSGLMLALAGAVLAQQPGGGGAPGGGRGGAGGAGAGGGGGQRAGGRGGAAAALATGPIADLVGKIVEAINKQDQAYLTSVLDPAAVWLDEDGHMPPASAWLTKLITGSPAKKFAVATTPSALRVSDVTPDTAWAAFNYTLDETATPRGGAPVANQMKGLASMLFKKVGTDWKVVLVHAPVTGLAITPH